MSLFPKFAYFAPLFWNTIPLLFFFDFQEAHTRKPSTTPPGWLPDSPVSLFANHCLLCEAMCSPCLAPWLKLEPLGVSCVWLLLARSCASAQLPTRAWAVHCTSGAAAYRALRFLPRCSPGPGAPNRVPRRRAVLRLSSTRQLLPRFI